MKHDLLADMFSVIKNTEDAGKKECTVPASNVIKGVLTVMKKHNYLQEFKFVENGKGGMINVTLVGRINRCNVVKPRFSIGRTDIIKWEKKFLPAEGVGILILTTSRGIIDQREAEKQNTGGKLLGYVY